jgi:putative addiction module component (TIGR02574 family)
MSALMKSLGLDRLSSDERVALANELLDSVVGEVSPFLTEAKRQELAARVAHLKAHPDDVVSWAEVETAALARFGK